MTSNFERLKQEIRKFTACGVNKVFFRIGDVIFDMKGRPVPSYVDHAIFGTCRDLKCPSICNPPQMPDIWKNDVKVDYFRPPKTDLFSSPRSGCRIIYDPDNIMAKIVDQLRGEYVLRGEGDARSVITALNKQCRERKYTKPLMLFVKNTSDAPFSKRNFSIPTIIVANSNMNPCPNTMWNIRAAGVGDIDQYVAKNGPSIILHFLHRWRS